MSVINFEKELEERSLLAAAVLSSDEKNIKEIVLSETYNPKELDLKIEVNGVEVHNMSFKEFLNLLSDEIKNSETVAYKEKVHKEAEMIVVEKMSEIIESMS